MKKRLGLLGGTFDPPHIAHLILAEEALFQLELRKILWILTPDPPHKRDREITPVEMRIELLTAALDHHPDFKLSSVDIDRPPPHYAVDTVKLIKSENPNTSIVYLMGSDSLTDLPTWHNPGDFINICDEIGVMLRPGVTLDQTEIEKTLPGILSKLRYIFAPRLEISSSAIRNRICLGQPFRFLVTSEVFLIIKKLKLYRE